MKIEKYLFFVLFFISGLGVDNYFRLPLMTAVMEGNVPKPLPKEFHIVFFDHEASGASQTFGAWVAGHYGFMTEDKIHSYILENKKVESKYSCLIVEK